MTIKTIIELQAKPGQRANLMKAIDEVLVRMKASSGFIGVTRYEVIDNPDSLIEIAKWETPEARQTWLEKSMASGVLSQLMGLLSVPFKAITVRELE